MILPINTLPKYSLYYIGGRILEKMNKDDKYNTSSLFDYINETEDISYKLFILSIDWLFIIEALKVVEEGGTHYVYKAIANTK